MTLSSLITFLIIGGIAGWLAGQLMKGAGFGLWINILIGVIGSILGGFVFGLLGFAATGIIGSIISATVGAVLLLFILSKVRS
ncbi:GlsB/YeaQ/YmgE family stress response membrane protein [Shewanella submarina]|nr:GlsB/YeaQ/YmgE family stress response membrane protein [Shewanella submarina]MCL1038084.1 GlsB/YeaQ/YmgE family stress response membrane protein [Shewanella submarina]